MKMWDMKERGHKVEDNEPAVEDRIRALGMGTGHGTLSTEKLHGS